MIRRVVLGNVNGRSVVVNDSHPFFSHRYEYAEGMESSFIWNTLADVPVSDPVPAESWSKETTVIPPLGGSSIIYMVVPPDSLSQRPNYNKVAAFNEIRELQPDVVAAYEPNGTGFHRTDSIDYLIVLEGEIVIEVDDCQEVVLNRSDVVIINGNRHTYHNRSSESARIMVVMIGARRE